MQGPSLKIAEMRKGIGRLREETAFPVVAMVFGLAAVHSSDVNLCCRPHTIKQISTNNTRHLEVNPQYRLLMHKLAALICMLLFCPMLFLLSKTVFKAAEKGKGISTGSGVH